MFNAGEFDICTVIYNKFISVISQEVTPLQIIPVQLPEYDKPSEAQDEMPNVQANYEFDLLNKKF